MSYEGRLAKVRGGFSFKYFQYLALLYTEIFFDNLTADPAWFLNELNGFLDRLKNREPSLRDFPHLVLKISGAWLFYGDRFGKDAPASRESLADTRLP